MRKELTAPRLLALIARFVTVFVLIVGAFLGFPNDPQLGGLYWIITAFHIFMDTVILCDDVRRSRR